jgi:hypothetical protein
LIGHGPGVCHGTYFDAENDALRARAGRGVLLGSMLTAGGIASSQRRCLQPLTPGRVAALLGEMTGAGVTSTGAGECLVTLSGAKIEVGETGGAMEAVDYTGSCDGKHRRSSLGRGRLVPGGDGR